MKGGFLHNHVLIGTCADALQLQGARVKLEYPVQPGRTGGSVDLFAVFDNLSLVIEAERSTERLKNDLRKATLLQADILLVVVPTWKLARAGTRLLAALAAGKDNGKPRTLCLPLGPALQRLANISHLMTARNVVPTLNPKIHCAPQLQSFLEVSR